MGISNPIYSCRISSILSDFHKDVCYYYCFCHASMVVHTSSFVMVNTDQPWHLFNCGFSMLIQMICEETTRMHSISVVFVPPIGRSGRLDPTWWCWNLDTFIIYNPGISRKGVEMKCFPSIFLEIMHNPCSCLFRSHLIMLDSFIWYICSYPGTVLKSTV